MAKPLLLPGSVGDALDRLTILDLKLRRIDDPVKLAHARAEHAAVLAAVGPEVWPCDLVVDLADVNARLWDVEDALRAKERRSEFDEEFVKLARSVYALNDRRADIKLRINKLTGSVLTEVKSYS